MHRKVILAARNNNIVVREEGREGGINLGPGKNGPGKKGPGKKGPVKRVQVKTVLGKNGPGKKGPPSNKLFNN